MIIDLFILNYLLMFIVGYVVTVNLLLTMDFLFVYLYTTT